MCWMCDDPKLPIADVRAFIAETIDRYGWMIQYVEGDRHHAPFAYTVGLTALERPELLVSGLNPSDSGELLDGMAWHLCHADPPAGGEQFDLDLASPVRVEVVRVAEPDVLVVACDWYGRAVDALQLVRADDRGRWPWDRSYRAGSFPQRVYGPRIEVDR